MVTEGAVAVRILVPKRIRVDAQKAAVQADMVVQHVSAVMGRIQAVASMVRAVAVKVAVVAVAPVAVLVAAAAAAVAVILETMAVLAVVALRTGAMALAAVAAVTRVRVAVGGQPFVFLTSEPMPKVKRSFSARVHRRAPKGVRDVVAAMDVVAVTRTVVLAVVLEAVSSIWERIH